MNGPRGGRRLALGALGAAAVIGMVGPGCGSSSQRTVDSAALERAVAATILGERHVQAAVQCPSNVPMRAGLAFTCTARLDVGTYPIAVTEKDDQGHVRYGNQAPLVVLDVTKVERAIAQSILAQRKLTATVSCPQTVLQKAGLRFTCTATVGGRAYPFEVTQVNDSGQVSYVGR
jgi:hypothetical protein